jgi:hypothetical protein
MWFIWRLSAKGVIMTPIGEGDFFPHLNLGAILVSLQPHSDLHPQMTHLH